MFSLAAPRSGHRLPLRAGLFLPLLALLTGCEAPAPEHLTFRYQLVAAPLTLDPAKSGDSYSAGVIDRLFDGLMRLDRVRNVPVPALAESFTVSEDGLVYDFRLHPRARFHNGRSILASDFKYSWERVLARETDSPDAGLFELIAGASAFRTGHAESVVGIEVHAAHQLRVRLKAPFVPFLYHVADPAASVVPQEEVHRMGESFGRQPIGSGPFRFGSWDNNRVELIAFRDHGQRPPQVQRLIYEELDSEEAMRRYQAGELDLVTTIPPGSLTSLQQMFSTDLRQFPGTVWSGFCFQCSLEPFDDPRVRRSLALAVNRDALIGVLGAQYTASVGFVPQGIPAHDPTTLTHGYDLEQAKALLVQSQLVQGVDSPALLYYTRTGELAERVAKFLIDAFAELSLKVSYKTINFSSILKAREERLGFYRFAWSGEYPDPEPYLRPLFHSQGQSNKMAYANPEVDRLLDAAQVEPNAAKRRALYRQAESLIIHDAPCVALFQSTNAILLRHRWKDIPLGYHPGHLEIEWARLAKGS